LEHADEVFVFPAEFGWSDLGTWTSLHSHLPQDLNGNVLIGSDISIHDSRNCIVHAENCKKVVVIGLNDCVVSEKDGNLLVCKLNEEERIKELTKK
jgi:mannose-1-phosphate guanylyltransferase